MKDIKVPGFLWVALIVAGVALAKRYIPDPFIVEVIVVIAFGILKAMNLGTAELEKIIALVVRRATTATGRDKIMRGPMVAHALPEPAMLTSSDVEAIEALRPNKTMRWLLG